MFFDARAGFAQIRLFRAFRVKICRELAISTCKIVDHRFTIVALRVGEANVEEAIKKANNMVIITTPASFADNKDEAIRFANPHEEHKCLIDESFYPKDAIVSEFGNQKLIIIKKK